MKRLRIPLLTCTFQVSGLYLEKLCNLLKEEGVPLLSAKRNSMRTMSCRCYESDLTAIQALTQSKGWAITDVKAESLSRTRRFLIARPGLLIGLCLMLALLLLGSQFVLRVTITGAKGYLPDMTAYLASQGVTKGAWARGIDLKALEQKLYFRYPTFGWFTATRRGMTVALSCRQGASPTDNEKEIRPLIALCDGVVERVQTHAGTPLVQAGQLVKKGQVLIDAYERSSDETTKPVAARGVVLARCWARCQILSETVEWVSTQTGREMQARQIVTPWYRLPDALETPDFLSYDTDISITPIGGVFFPVSLKTARYQEVALEKRQRAMDEVKREAEQAVLRKLSSLVDSDEIVDKWVDYCMIESGELSVIATAELRRNIAVPE